MQEILYALAAALAALSASIVPLKFNITTKRLTYLLALSAGILISIAFIDVLPQAFALSSFAGFGILAGFLIINFMEQFVITEPSSEITEDCKLHKVSMTAFAGLLFHSFIDGVAIAAGFGVSAALGAVITFAVVIHAIPDGISASSLLLASKYSSSRRKVFSLASVIALAKPAGTVAFLFLAGSVNALFLSVVLGVSAGSFIYVSAAGLLPHIHREKNLKVFLVFVLGIFLVLLGSLV